MDVYTGRHLELTVTGQRVLDMAYAAHPERFVRGRPTPPVVPDEVWINRPTGDLVTVGSTASDPARPQSPSGGKEARPALEAALQRA